MNTSLSALLPLLLLLPLASCRTSEEWRGRTIYQLLTDRFGVGGGNPAEPCRNLKDYCGGNFRGIVDKLDYIQDLGFSAIWISPIVLNAVWRRGYHGYWAQDIYRVEPHFGTEQELKALIEECHRRDIWVMLDVVPNHMGYEERFKHYDKFVPFNRPEHYHEYCRLKNHMNQTEVEICRLCGLPDLNQTVPYVRDTLYQWIRGLTERYDFDGYRLDTAKHISKTFWPGFGQAAGAFLLGEVGADETRTEYIASYQEVIEGLLNFPTFSSLNRVFHDSRPMWHLSANLAVQREVFRDLGLTAPFADSHDAPRFLHRNPDVHKLESALAVVLFGDGIPIVYSGTELGFNGGKDPQNRESLWPAIDKNPQDHQLYKFIRRSLQVRRDLSNRFVIPKQPAVEKLTDERTYAFTRGEGSQLIVAVSNQKRVFGGYAVSIPGVDAPEGTVYREAHNSSDLVVVEDDGIVRVAFADELGPKVYLRVEGELGREEKEALLRLRAARRGGDAEGGARQGKQQFAWSRRARSRKAAKKPKMKEDSSYLPQYGYLLQSPQASPLQQCFSSSDAKAMHK